jgi:hypothetical protein
MFVRRSAAPLAFTLALSACGGDKPTELPPATSTVSISPDNPTLAIGETVTLSATARDAAGGIVSGRPVAWTTSQPHIATVDPTSGLVTAVSVGVAIIRATIDTKSDQVLITVAAPVASVDVTARRTTVGISGTLQLTATTRDATGVTLTGRAVTWSSSDETKARVSETGMVTGVAAGSVTITATSEGVRGTIAIEIADVLPPQISGISPATLGPGVTVTISGANFDANPADLDVTIAGLTVAVTAATATQLTVQLPAFVPCQPTQNVSVSVSGVGGAATRAHPLRVAVQRSVAVGEMLVLAGADLHCNELPQTAGRYAIAVINSSTAPSATASFVFRGLAISGAAASAAPLARAATAAIPPASGIPPRIGSPEDRTALQQTLRAHLREHARLLEKDRAILGNVPALRRAIRAARRPEMATTRSMAAAAATSQAGPVPLTVGSTATMKFGTSDNNCRDFKNVEARVVHVGPRSVVLESTDAPLAGTMDADYVRLGSEYDNVMHQILVEKFGDPVAYDTATDNNQRIVMLFAKALNDQHPNVLGRVRGCDLIPPEVNAPNFAASNLAEVFYARVPTSTEVNYSSINTRVGWMRLMRATIIHEAKHITSAASRFAAPEEARFIFDESWLEEGTAEMAVEFYGRASAYATWATWRGNATYANTMRCDFRPQDASCTDSQRLVADIFARLYDYYSAIENKSFLSSTVNDDDVYGSGYLFARWVADQYASDEGAFFRAVIRETQVTGLASMEARTGRTYAELHPAFMMALYADDYPGLSPPAEARYTIQTWNMRDMFKGYSADFPATRPQAFPLRVQAVTYGTFSANVSSVIGGAAAYLELAGTPSSPQVLDLHATTGLALPAGTTLRLAILRVQ